jgi:hypothetical protein
MCFDKPLTTVKLALRVHFLVRGADINKRCLGRCGSRNGGRIGAIGSMQGSSGLQENGMYLIVWLQPSVWWEGGEVSGVVAGGAGDRGHGVEVAVIGRIQSSIGA